MLRGPASGKRRYMPREIWGPRVRFLQHQGPSPILDKVVKRWAAMRARSVRSSYGTRVRNSRNYKCGAVIRCRPANGWFWTGVTYQEQGPRPDSRTMANAPSISS